MKAAPLLDCAGRVLWRAGFRISEALALTETDLDPTARNPRA